MYLKIQYDPKINIFFQVFFVKIHCAIYQVYCINEYSLRRKSVNENDFNDDDAKK